MKESKAVYVTRRDIKESSIDNHISRNLKTYDKYNELAKSRNANRKTQNIGCQHDWRRDNVICSCRNYIAYNNTSQGINNSSKSYTDIGVGSIKAFQRRKVKKIYLPETDDRCVGSSGVLSLTNRRIRYDGADGYYHNPKTSSKCVGGAIEYKPARIINEQLSPIIQIKSNTTGTTVFILEPKNNTESESNIITNSPLDITKQVEREYVKKLTDIKIERQIVDDKIISEVFNHSRDNKLQEDILSTCDKTTFSKDIKIEIEEKFSSDSLVQHVHNLEVTSNETSSRLSLDPMENTLEQEYRKLFSVKEPKTVKDKPIPNYKSTSLLRQRFEALRRSLVKKEDPKKYVDILDMKLSNQASVKVHKDVSIASDPPSLEGKSYSNIKIYAPYPSYLQSLMSNFRDMCEKSDSIKKNKEKTLLTPAEEEAYSEGVKGMFKLWGKKFNLEDDGSQRSSHDIMKKNENKKDTESPKAVSKEEKKGRKLFFFRKKKDKSKQYKVKKGITAGRCEVGEGLMIKVGVVNNKVSMESPKKEVESVSVNYEDILQKSWIKNYLTNTLDPKESVRVRWNNNMYATSSSTVLELMDNVYKETGVVFKSRSEVSKEGSSHYYGTYKKKQRISFVHQDIEAWMIPKTVIDRPMELPLKIISNPENREIQNNLELKISDGKCSIDKSKAFARKIELVLQSKNAVKAKEKASSEYLRIDIPKDYFGNSSIDEVKYNQLSDEEVYKIVEYDNLNSNININKIKDNNELNISEDLSQDVKINNEINSKAIETFESKIVETMLQKPSSHKDVLIQVSNVLISRCDVIGVGIITQRDIREIRKPILKIQDDFTDDDSMKLLHQKKCEFAESYLQDYYRHWTPMGMDLHSWCISDTHVNGSSENSHCSINNQGDGTKSCPNIFDEFQTTTIISPCNTSSCSRCVSFEEETKIQDKGTSKFFKKFIMKSKANTTKDSKGSNKRVDPKDSLEVFKRRKLYACSNKSKWICQKDKPSSVSSSEDENCPKIYKSPKPIKKPCKKHVSMPDCDTINDLLTKQLADKSPEGILSFKGAAGCDMCKKKGFQCPKHSTVNENQNLEISEPPCQESCKKDKKAPCMKPNQLSCNPPDSPICSSPRSTPIRPCSSCKSKSSCMSCTCSVISEQSIKCSPNQPKAISPACSPNKNKSSPTPSRKIESCSPPQTRRKTNILPSPPNSKCSLKLVCPKELPKKSPKKISPCNLVPCKNKSPPAKKKKSPPKCPTSPCKKPVPPKTGCSIPSCKKERGSDQKLPQIKSNEYPWPLKNQVSNQPSPEISNTSSPCKPAEVKDSNKCKTSCKYSPTNQKPEEKKKDDCIPNCANKPPTPPPCCEQPQIQKECQTKSQPKLTGLFLRKNPSMKKTCSKECLAWENEIEQGVIRLNSRERISIRMKKDTPSTEEIREGLNIKVKDEDGQTLIERKDYIKDRKRHKPSVLGDMYSNVHRISTPTIVEGLDANQPSKQAEDEKSIANLVEIQFKLKVTQGEKTTEINIGNDNVTEKEKQLKRKELNNTPQEIYHVKDGVECSTEDINAKNDVSIKILIKNFKSKSNKKRLSEKYVRDHILDEDYSKKIIEKFHTVSTGYSDVPDEMLDTQAFSVHRATVDLTSSADKTQSDHNEVLLNKELSAQKCMDVMSNVIDKTKYTCPYHDKLICRSKLDSLRDIDVHNEKIDEPNEVMVKYSGNSEKINLYSKKASNKNNSADDIIKPRTSEQKKRMLKKIFDKAAIIDKEKSREKMKQLRDMLRVILTSDSSEQIHNLTVTSNELAKDVTYTSLKPNYFKNTDSMNNYYKVDTAVESSEISVESKQVNMRHPSTQNTQFSEKESDVSSIDMDYLLKNRCLCSEMAAGLNLCRTDAEGACCCGKAINRNEATNCDLRTKDDIMLLNFKTVGTQNSKKFSRTTNSTNLSIRSDGLNNLNENIPTNYLFQLSGFKENDKSYIQRNKSMLENDYEMSNPKTYYNGNFLNPNRKFSIENAKKVRCDRFRIDRKENSKLVNIEGTDILQSYETKKAVLEIYAEKTISNGNEHFVAKLPKFVYEKESEICENYKEIATNNYKSDCKSNVVMMSVKR